MYQHLLTGEITVLLINKTNLLSCTYYNTPHWIVIATHWGKLFTIHAQVRGNAIFCL